MSSFVRSTSSWLVLLALAASCGEDGGGPSPAANPPASESDAGVEAAAIRTPIDAASAALPELCSGCTDEQREVGDNAVHFHHVHINTADIAESEAFYERVFRTVKVRLNGQVDVEKADAALILFREVARQPTDVLAHGIEHIGWGSTDVAAWYQAAQQRDIRTDQRVGAGVVWPIELTFDRSLGSALGLVTGPFFVVYVQGPANERIEINTEAHDGFGHVHFMTDDVDTTVAWYEALLDVSAVLDEATATTIVVGGAPSDVTGNAIKIDKVNMIFFGPPASGVPAVFQATDDAPIHHIAFAFADLDPVIERVATLGLEVATEVAIEDTYGFRSLLLQAPNEALVELVEAAPMPDLP